MLRFSNYIFYYSLCSICLLILVLSFNIRAQTIDESTIIQQQNRVLQQEQQRIDQLEQEIRNKQKAPPSISFPKSPAQQFPDSDQCFFAKQINLIDATFPSPAKQQSLTKDYVNRCVTLAELNELIAIITNFYFEKGYVTARITIGPQDISDEIIDLLVVEGKVEAILMNGQPTNTLELKTAFPHIIDRPLNIRDFEQGLDQMNGLRSNQATIEINAGTQQGSSIVDIINIPGKKWFLEASVNNSGSDETGLAQGSIKAETNNLFQANDLLVLEASKNISDGIDLGSSESLYFLASLPYGYWDFQWSSNYYYYQLSIISLDQKFINHGISRNNGLTVTNTIYRNKASLLNIEAGITVKDTLNYLDQVKLTANSYRLTTTNIGMNYTVNALGGTLLVGGNYHRGITAFDAHDDENREDQETENQPQSQFEKYSYNLSYIHRFLINGFSFKNQHSLSGQWSKDTLYGNERISIGSPTTVRGYENASISGDQGFYIRNKLNLEFTPSTNNIRKIEPFIALDYGHIKKDESDPLEKGYLSGMAIGLNASGDHMNLDLTLSKPFEHSNFIEEKGYSILTAFTLKF